MNSVNEIGRLSKDPELKYISNNKAICEFTIAVDDGFGDNKKTFFFLCKAWSKTGEMISKHFSKGDQIGISGRLTQETWDNPEGKKQSKTTITVENVTFCAKKKGQAESDNFGLPDSLGYTVDNSDDDLPF